MTERDETLVATHVWEKLAAPLDQATIAWRQDGKPSPRDGKFFARFVAYVEANTVRERLDSVVPGEWEFTVEILPPAVQYKGGEVDDATAFSFKGRLSILGVTREDVGTGKDYKQASTDTFKRCAVRFGIAHELYDYEQNWVQVDSDSKYAKPVEDPAAAYAKRQGRAPMPAPSVARAASPAADAPRQAPASVRGTDEMCCGSVMWNDTVDKRNPRGPDYRCRVDRSHVIWPVKNGVRGDTRPQPADSNDEASVA